MIGVQALGTERDKQTRPDTVTEGMLRTQPSSGDFANSHRPHNNPVQVVIPTLSPPSVQMHVHTSMHAYTYTPVTREGVKQALRQLYCPPPVRMHPRLESGHVEQSFHFPFSGISESLTGPSTLGVFPTEARMVQGLPSIALTSSNNRT